MNFPLLFDAVIFSILFMYLIQSINHVSIISNVNTRCIWVILD